MTHLLTRIISYTELRALFDSPETQEFLRTNSKKTKGTEPFLYTFISNDNPNENVAVAWIFPERDAVWIELLVIDDVQYIPQYPPA